MGTQPQNADSMGRRRALLTDRERELLASEDDEEREYRYQAASRIRNKIEEELTDDIGILEEHHPELLDELRDVVCVGTPSDLTFSPLGRKNVSYGPSSRGDAAYVLRVGTGDGTVEIHLDEDEMYELWTEVQHTPWPDTLDEQEEAGKLRHRLVDLAMGADAEMLQNALNALDPHWQER